MLVRWVMSSLRTPLECTQKIGARKPSSPNIFVEGVQLFYLITSRRQLFPKTTSHLLPSAWCWLGKHTLLPIPHMRTTIFGKFSIAIFNHNKGLGLTFRRLFVLYFINSLVHFFLFQFSMSCSITLHQKGNPNPE